jgi:hypothetical protein
MGIDLFIHAANILLLLAYSVTDILWLRLLAVASSLAAIPYFLLQPTPLWAAFGWSVLFAGIYIDGLVLEFQKDVALSAGALWGTLPPNVALLPADLRGLLSCAP